MPFPSVVGQPVPHPVAQKAYLLTTKRYAVHKILGACYVLLWLRLLVLLTTHRIDEYATAPWWHAALTLHALGLTQTCSALFAFSFLPRAQRHESFFGDKTTISKAFVKENAYFVALSVFASLYAAPRGRRWLRRRVVGQLVEFIFIFVPYQTLRKCFPKTSFERGNLNKSSTRNARFFRLSKYVASYFYLFGKHYVGNLLNYAMFLDLDSARFRGHMYWILLGAGYSLTIGVFLHTLKFRKVLGPRTAIGAYLLGYAISGLPTLNLMFGGLRGVRPARSLLFQAFAKTTTTTSGDMGDIPPVSPPRAAAADAAPLVDYGIELLLNSTVGSMTTTAGTVAAAARTLMSVAGEDPRLEDTPHPGACLDARLWALATGGLACNLLGGSGLLSRATAYRLALAYQLAVAALLYRQRWQHPHHGLAAALQ